MALYGDIIADQVKRGFIEQVNVSCIPEDCHFNPHHPVKKDSTTTPLRIVYDCSCRQSPTKPSLNDCLQAGLPSSMTCCTCLDNGYHCVVVKCHIQPHGWDIPRE